MELYLPRSGLDALVGSGGVVVEEEAGVGSEEGAVGDVKMFYACSAYRNRKDCDFYQEGGGDKVTQARLFRYVVAMCCS